MKSSWKIGTFAGVVVYMHTTFLLLLVWIAITHWMQYRALLPTVLGVSLTVAVLLCVVLHEYGHIFAARRFGMATKDITVLPIGGMARMERVLEKPNQELWVALAGPAVNVALASILGVYLWLTGHFEPVGQIGLMHGMFLERILFANLFLAGFNLIPAFPIGRRACAARSSGQPNGIQGGDSADGNRTFPYWTRGVLWECCCGRT